MLYGVTINGVDVLTRYGLALCADLRIGQPKLKSRRVDIPGGDGTLNMSYAPQGGPVFEERSISFSLFKAMDEAERDRILSELRNAWHGREVDLILPNDTAHAWHGEIAFGDISGYNAGTIPVTMIADPYKRKLALTTVTEEIDGEGVITLSNEREPVSPSVTVTAAVTLAWDGYSVAVAEGTQRIPQLVLEQGETAITATGSATVTFAYREGSL